MILLQCMNQALAKFMESESNSPEIPALLPTSAGAKVVDAHCITGQGVPIESTWVHQ